MKELIDIWDDNFDARRTPDKSIIFYRYIPGRTTKNGKIKSGKIDIAIHESLLEKLGWQHKNCVRIRTDYENIFISKAPIGYSLCFNSCRGKIRFTALNRPFSRENQNIDQYEIEGPLSEVPILKFKIKPLEIKIPKDNINTVPC